MFNGGTEILKFKEMFGWGSIIITRLSHLLLPGGVRTLLE
jgi:hypothetical protein